MKIVHDHFWPSSHILPLSDVECLHILLHLKIKQKASARLVKKIISDLNLGSRIIADVLIS